MAVKKYVELELHAPPSTRLIAEPRTNHTLEPGSPLGATMVISMHGEAHVTRKDFRDWIKEVESEWDECEQQHKEEYKKRMEAERKNQRLDH